MCFFLGGCISTGGANRKLPSPLILPGRGSPSGPPTIHSSPCAVHLLPSPAESDHTTSLLKSHCWWLISRKPASFLSGPQLPACPPHTSRPGLQPRGPPLSSWKKPHPLCGLLATLRGGLGVVPGEAHSSLGFLCSFTAPVGYL